MLLKYNKWSCRIDYSRSVNEVKFRCKNNKEYIISRLKSGDLYSYHGILNKNVKMHYQEYLNKNVDYLKYGIYSFYTFNNYIADFTGFIKRVDDDFNYSSYYYVVNFNIAQITKCANIDDKIYNWLKYYNIDKQSELCVVL